MPNLTPVIAGLPLREEGWRQVGAATFFLQPSIDIVSVGAGGGSIAWIDAEGGLRIGPHSAQADPGPVCFGLAGQELLCPRPNAWLF